MPQGSPLRRTNPDHVKCDYTFDQTLTNVDSIEGATDMTAGARAQADGETASERRPVVAGPQVTARSAGTDPLAGRCRFSWGAALERPRGSLSIFQNP